MGIGTYIQISPKKSLLVFSLLISDRRGFPYPNMAMLSVCDSALAMSTTLLYSSMSEINGVFPFCSTAPLFWDLVLCTTIFVLVINPYFFRTIQSLSYRVNHCSDYLKLFYLEVIGKLGLSIFSTAARSSSVVPLSLYYLSKVFISPKLPHSITIGMAEGLSFMISNEGT